MAHPQELVRAAVAAFILQEVPILITHLLVEPVSSKAAQGVFKIQLMEHITRQEDLVEVHLLIIIVLVISKPVMAEDIVVGVHSALL